ncbi:MAG: non-hydrolyzing UDP-N-acetylglucosamine 2-epimerase [Sphingomonadaceae bacterium]
MTLIRRVVTVVGTRPEAIKMAPVVLALRDSPMIESMLLATGQHSGMFDDALASFGLAPDLRLDADLTALQPEVMAGEIKRRLMPFLRDLDPALVLVQGDTTSALAAAQAASSCSIPVGHVEAGLRSHDLARPWPEEGNRIAIDRLATLLFAPTEGNLANLAADSEVKGEAYLTGNSGIDALLHILRATPPRPKHEDRSQLLVTLHRRETIGRPMEQICTVLRDLADRGDVVLTVPLHPNPSVRSIVTSVLTAHPAIALIEPLPYPDMIARIAASDLILSDSGGVQEEAPALGVPLLIARDVTERPEAVSCGGAILCGTDPETIRREAIRLIDDPASLATMAVPRFPFGRGDASGKIVAVIEDYLASRCVT